jgi:hypothetical protein
MTAAGKVVEVTFSASVCGRAAMSYTTVLAYVDAAAMADEAVRVAAGLADKFHATLIGEDARI